VQQILKSVFYVCLRFRGYLSLCLWVRNVNKRRASSCAVLHIFLCSVFLWSLQPYKTF